MLLQSIQTFACLNVPNLPNKTTQHNNQSPHMTQNITQKYPVTQHTLTNRSTPPLTTFPSSNCKQTTPPPCPLNVILHFPLSKSQILIVVSLEPVQMLVGVNWRQWTVEVWPWRVRGEVGVWVRFLVQKGRSGDKTIDERWQGGLLTIF